MTDTMTSQNIVFSSWDTLYILVFSNVIQNIAKGHATHVNVLYLTEDIKNAPFYIK
jgi:hypothetical protein